MTVLDAIPVDRIRAQAREIQFARTLLTLIAAVFYGLGWIVAKTWIVTWTALAFCMVAVKTGWVDARPPRPSSTR